MPRPDKDEVIHFPETVKNKPVFSEAARLWHSAFIGKTGSGKTYAARGEVEDLLDLGRQVIIIDPTGAWSGLRMKPDGTPSGYNIAIFGGSSGDKPLTPDMAPTLGRIAGTTNRSMILDLSGISLELEDQREIVYQFLRNLYRLNRKPVHLFIDEADEYSPQELDKDTKQLRTLVARIMARGRSLGFRCTLITQRPAKIDKNSISQIESMAVLRVTAPQDRTAVVDWFSDKGGADRKEILNGLGSLQTGEGWVFTGLDGTYEHRRFRKIRTYDSSSTPTDDDGNVIHLDKGYIDLRIFDEQLQYPDEVEESELEKTIAKRRNLEEDNRKLRSRLLKSESRYEAMRQVFVEIKKVVDAAMIDNPLEAVDYADLLILRNQVDDDIKSAERESRAEPFDLNDITGVPEFGGFEKLAEITPYAKAEDVERPVSSEKLNVVPTAPAFSVSASNGEENVFKTPFNSTASDIIAALDTKPHTEEELIRTLSVKPQTVERNLSFLMDEGAIYFDGKNYHLNVSTIARQMTEVQIRALKIYVDDPLMVSDSVKDVTKMTLRRLKVIDSNGKPTARGFEIYDIFRRAEERKKK